MHEPDFLADQYDPYAFTPSAHDYEFHTGDPRQDLEYERQYSQAIKIQEPVKNFLLHLQKAIVECNVFEIQNLYENSYVKLTERCFKTIFWPDVEDVRAVVKEGADSPFVILYKELYYRHIYARVPGGPTPMHRYESYYNYCQLFNFILNPQGPAPLELPNQWLWDIIDEFIYQFQSFCQYRSKLIKKTEEEITFLKEYTKIWNVHSVLNVLHSLVEKSNIKCQLEVYTSGGDPDSVAGEFGRNPLYKMLGYFSLVGLLRLHSLLGDYYQAIKVLENIELNKRNLYSRVPACQVTTYYYVGFAYLMMRRYADSIRTFSDILLYIQRTRQIFQQRTYQVDQINKQTEQMYTLLAICLVLHPQQIDESILSHLKDNFGEKMLRMQRGDLKEFENCFGFACPKFLSPVAPSLDTATPGNYHMESYMLQLKVFMDEVQQQLMLPTIRSYLKLYTTMPISKLAAFLDMSDEQFRTNLLTFKHKMKNIVWTKGTSGLEGEFQSGSEVDFYIDRNMIHIADTKIARRYGDFFIRQIHKFEDVYEDCESPSRRTIMEGNFPLEVKTHRCTICCKSFARKYYLNKHLKVHTGKKAHRCRFCSETFTQRIHLLTHSKVHTGDKPYQCLVCGKRFALKQTLDNHSRIHTGEKPHQCTVCGKTFSRKPTLEEHLRIHTGEKPYQCTVCSKVFSRRVSFKEHLKVHTGEKPHRCTVCGKSFTQRSHLQTHCKVHTGDKPHQCIVCGKTFAQKTTLRNHLRVHSGEKPYLCNVCGKAFALGTQLKLHLRVHTGEKPHVCTVCRKSFSDKTNLNSHWKVHTGEKEHECPVCKKSFSAMKSLKNHLRVHTRDPTLLS